MKKKFLIMIAVITAVISCLWFFLKPAAKDPTLVTLYGNVDIRQFDIGFQVPGQITKMYFEEGDTIREGSLVAEIDAADYKLQEAKSMINILFYMAQALFPSWILKLWKTP